MGLPPIVRLARRGPTPVPSEEAAASCLPAEARAKCIVCEPQLHERGCALPFVEIRPGDAKVGGIRRTTLGQ